MGYDVEDLARDAMRVPIIAEQINQSVQQMGEVINKFEEYLDASAPVISIKHKEEKENVDEV
jgi:hypothetical protein